jgi:hypothetical protein
MGAGRDVGKITAERLMTSRVLCLVLCAALAACAGPRATIERSAATVTVEPPPAVPLQWRAVARPDALAGIDALPSRWDRALAAVRGWRRPAVAAEGALLDPAGALARPLPPPGRYRCRYLRLAPGQGGFQTFRPWSCFVAEDGELTTLSKADGSERPAGRLWPDGERRLVFLGAVTRNGDPAAPAYGDDPATDAVGLLERIGDFQWRLVLLRSGDAGLDVVELIPDVPPATAP